MVKTPKGYILLAEDGTTNELHPTKKALDNFGFVGNQYIRNEDEAQKATCRSAALYDITNSLVVDFSMNPWVSKIFGGLNFRGQFRGLNFEGHFRGINPKRNRWHSSVSFSIMFYWLCFCEGGNHGSFLSI